MADLWPYVPAPEILEALVWKTDVQSAIGSEMRYALRGGRQTLTLRFPRSGDYLKAEAKLRADPYGDFDVPIWIESCKPGEILAGATSIAADMEAEYIDRALIFAGPDSWEIVTIAAVGADLTLSAPVVGTYATPTVMPIKQGAISEGAKITRTSYRHGALEIAFLLRLELAAAGSAFPIYSALPVLLCSGAIFQPLSGSISQSVELVDNGFGPVVIAPMRDVLRARYMLSLNFTDRSALQEFKRFLGDMRGRDGEFWGAAWGGRMALNADLSLGATAALIAPIFETTAEYVGRHVQIGDEFRQVIDATNVVDSHELQFAALTAPASSARLLAKYRLDTDRIEIAHRRGFDAQTGFVIQEVFA